MKGVYGKMRFTKISIISFVSALLCCTAVQAQSFGSDRADIDIEVFPPTTELNTTWQSAEANFRMKDNSIALFGQNISAPTDRASMNYYNPDLTDRFETQLRSLRSGIKGIVGSSSFDRLSMYAGDDSFFSTAINRDIDVDHAKLAGMSVDIGQWTIGGGYTWGEDNPGYFLEPEGVIGGLSYRGNNWNIQFSGMTTGHDAIGFEMGEYDYRYNGFSVGMNYSITDKTGLSAMVQYLDRYEFEEDQFTDNLIVTIGTRITF